MNRSIFLLSLLVLSTGLALAQPAAPAGGRGPGAPVTLTPAQTAAVNAINARLQPQMQAVAEARVALTTAAFAHPLSAADMRARVQALAAAEQDLALARAEAFVELQAGWNRLSPEQAQAIMQSAGRGEALGIAPPAGRGRGGVGIQQGTGRVSPHETISANIGGRVISVTYGRPYSKDPSTGATRKIWGGLVPWNAAWRLGSDEATLLLTPVDLVFGGSVNVPAGAYTLYLMPMETGASQLVFSRAVGKWGVPVDTSADVARVDLRKSELTPANEQFTMAFEAVPPVPGAAPGPSPSVTLKLMWESTQFAVDFAVK